MVSKRESKHAVIYFSPGSAPAMKDLAGQIRGEGGRTTLVWSAKWRGPENLIAEARAVIIERGCANAEKIAAAYEKYGEDVEIHYVNSDGYGEDATAKEAADAPIEETHSEPVRAEEESHSDADTADAADAVEPADDEPEDVSSDPVSDAEGDDSGVDEEDRVES